MSSDFIVPPDWHLNFFTAPVNAFWEMMVSAQATSDELEFIIRHIPAVPPGRILDIPCGSGRHALSLARAGYAVTGVDISQDAVSRASANAAAGNLPAHFRRQDMRFVDVEAPCDAIICLGNSISYFPIEETRAFFARLAAALKPEGRLILDSYCCAESIFPLPEERELTFDGGSYRSAFAYDPERSVLKTKAQLTLGREVHDLRYAHQILTCGELVRLLESAGLEAEALYANLDDAPYAPGSPRLILVARCASSP